MNVPSASGGPGRTLDFKDGRGENVRDVRRVKLKLHDKKGAWSISVASSAWLPFVSRGQSIAWCFLIDNEPLLTENEQPGDPIDARFGSSYTRT